MANFAVVFLPQANFAVVFSPHRQNFPYKFWHYAAAQHDPRRAAPVQKLVQILASAYAWIIQC